jgi:hypothetical protein
VNGRDFVITAYQWNERFRDALPPTSDDVCITADGRRLDTPEKVIAFLEELNA